jgi:Zn-dependent peptidase ImmA (M78 family)/transcriptional regulator with XRE-family HTH domain
MFKRKEIDMSIGERIKQMRKANGFSLRGLAQNVNVSAMAISKYERDEDVPSSGVLLRLSGALKAPLDFFLRPATIRVEFLAYRKHASLGIKDQEAIQGQIQNWIERYLELESFFNDSALVNLPCYDVANMEDVEKAAQMLRCDWELGLDPIENVMELFEDRGIKVGLVTGFEDFDACIFKANETPVIVVREDIPGDRQRFNLCHELGHLVLNIGGDLDEEKAAHRFASAFLIPAESVRFELGDSRSNIDLKELELLKHKYGLSMQAWIYRAKDLGIISSTMAESYFKRFRQNHWNRNEPGEIYLPERPQRMERLVYRAMAEDIISRSKVKEYQSDFMKQPV